MIDASLFTKHDKCIPLQSLYSRNTLDTKHPKPTSTLCMKTALIFTLCSLNPCKIISYYGFGVYFSPFFRLYRLNYICKLHICFLRFPSLRRLLSGFKLAILHTNKIEWFFSGQLKMQLCVCTIN